MFDYDGEYSRNLKGDLIRRIGIETIFIFAGNYMWEGH